MASGEPAVADLVKMMVEDRKRWEAELEKREKALETERARREEELVVEREAYLMNCYFLLLNFSELEKWG